MSQDTRRYRPRTPCVWGDESRILTYRRRVIETEAFLVWATAFVEVLDPRTKQPLPGFSSPLAADLTTSTKPIWQAAYGSAAGQVHAISSDTRFLVRWTGTDGDGNPIKAGIIEWLVKAR